MILGHCRIAEIQDVDTDVLGHCSVINWRQNLLRLRADQVTLIAADFRKRKMVGH